MKSVFPGDTCVGENTSQPASVELCPPMAGKILHAAGCIPLSKKADAFFDSLSGPALAEPGRVLLSSSPSGRTAPRRSGIEWAEGGCAVENRILARLEGRLGGQVSLIWLLTLFTVLPLDAYTLEEWNGALSEALGHRVSCPSYRALNQYLHRAVLGVQ